MDKQSLWVAANVVSFRGLDVVDGEINISDDEYQEWLDEVYSEEVEVCGMTMRQSSILKECDPVAFRCGKNDYESQIQSELEEQLEQEDSDGIEWEIDPADVEDEEDSEEE